MLRKQSGVRHWSKLLCLIILYVLISGSTTGTARAQARVPVPTPREQQVVGGEDATVGEFPWQGWFTFRTSGGTYSCGASLIHSKWVLTAAHCANNAIISQVLLGAHTMSDSSDPGRQVLPVQAVHVHPDFNWRGNDNDIALIELATPATENERVRSIAIVNDTTDAPLYAPDELAIVTGWGALSEGGMAADTLQKVELPIVDLSTCNETYDGGVTEKMLCAGYPEGGKDSCQGDSGGPLIVSDGMDGWKQAGIVSWGVGCARPDFYGVYTRVASYTEWIITTTNGEIGTPPTPAPTSSATLTSTGTALVTATVPPATPSATIPPATATPSPTEPATEPTTAPVQTETPTPTATAPVTPSDPSPTFAPSATATASPSPAPALLPEIINGNFNAGPTGAWIESIEDQVAPGLLIYSGELIPAADSVEGYAAWLGGPNRGRAALSQTVSVPDLVPVALIFDYEIQSNESCGHESARVQMADPGESEAGDVILAAFDLCAATETGGWQTALLDLTPLAGQTRTLQFIVETGDETSSDFFLDSVDFTNQLVDGVATGLRDDLAAMALTAQPGAQNVALDWEAPHVFGVAGYRVLRWDGQSALVVREQGPETYFVDSYDAATNPLVRGAEYCYSVEALDGDGASLGHSNRACAVHGQLALHVPDLVGRPGQTLAVPVAINNAEGIQITDADLWLDFDPRVLAMHDVVAAPLSAEQLDWTYSQTDLSDAVQRLRIRALPRTPASATDSLDGGDDAVLHGGGTLFWLYFDVVGAAGTASPLTLQPVNSSGAGSAVQVQDDGAGAWSVPLALQSGTAEIVAPGQPRATLGDVTGEGQWDEADARAVLQFTAERAGLTVPQRRASDVTGDNKINAADAALIYYRARAGAWTTSTPQRSPDASAQVDTTIALRGAPSPAGGTVTTTLQITNAQEMAGADLVIAYDPTVITGVVEISMGGALQDGAVSWHGSERGFVNIALATAAPIDGNALLLHIVWQLAENAPAASGPDGQVRFSLLDVHLSDGVGRDFVTGFANHTLRGESTPISLAANQRIFLPTILRPETQ